MNSARIDTPREVHIVVQQTTTYSLDSWSCLWYNEYVEREVVKMVMGMVVTLVLAIPLLAFIIALCAVQKTEWVEQVISEKEINRRKGKKNE